MSGTDYNYDSEVRLCASMYKIHTDSSQGQFFPYFILTVTTLITVPATISFFRPSKGAHPHPALCCCIS